MLPMDEWTPLPICWDEREQVFNFNMCRGTPKSFPPRGSERTSSVFGPDWWKKTRWKMLWSTWGIVGGLQPRSTRTAMFVPPRTVLLQDMFCFMILYVKNPDWCYQIMGGLSKCTLVSSPYWLWRHELLPGWDTSEQHSPSLQVRSN